ncbi:MAG: ATP synthase F1 subunit gamma [Dehalococcoidia bacterium]
MATVREIRLRIRSVGNTARVTRAMQMIAASKMRRAQERVSSARPYAEKLRAVLAGLAAQGAGEGDMDHPLLERRPVSNVLLLEITPDRGLAGGLVSAINRVAGRFMLAAQSPTSVVTVGKKGRDFMVRAGRDVKGSFIDMGDAPSVADTLPVTTMLQRMYTEGEVDEVHIAYTRFVNTMVQEAVVTQLLPVDTGELVEPGGPVDYIYEPDADAVLGALLPRFLETQVYLAFLESAASEQSARMVAMQKATDAANDMVDELTLEMNKARQNSITAELLDLVGGVAALEG